jgi:cytochrome c-type biogenesis protein CcmH
MRRLARLALLPACLVVLLPVLIDPPAAPAATNPDEILADPVLERRARDLSKQLRCLVCQNQSIDDSDADLARDLRRVVREQLVAGKSDEEIIGYLTARYGDFVLLKPPVKPATWGLWFGPALVLLIAVGGIAVYLSRRRWTQIAPPTPLSAEEQAKLDALLGGAESPERS